MSLFSALQEKGLWRGYERCVVGLEPILVDMSRRGMPVSPVAMEEVVALLKRDMSAANEAMQALVPDEIRGRVVYKREPRKKTAAHRQAEDGSWYRLKLWKPSNKGLVAYIKFRGHTVPKHIKTKKDTTAAIEIKRLAASTGDALYGKVIEYRKAGTVLTNHIKNWRPGADERVHSTFYCDPATGQLSSRRPCVQNAPKHDDEEFGGYAEQFRSMIKATQGHKIMEFDYHGFHVQTLAFEAQDLDMLRIGKIDIHSFVTAHFLRLGEASKLFGMPNDELRDFLAWVKKNHKHTRNAQVKHALLGYNNGMGYRKLFKQYMEFFRDEREAKQVLQLLDHLFPRAKAYRDRICQVAHEQGYLISRHGFIRYFWEVFRWQGGDWSHGDDHEAALCYFTQNDAHGELRERMLTLREMGLDERYRLLNTIHDSLIFECPDELVEECYAIVKGVMEAPSKVLIDPVVAPGGLSIEVDVEVGEDWGHMRGMA